MIITVFGASAPDLEQYNEAYRLGYKIGQSGNILKNGGYGGTMEASAKGCMEAGGAVVGVGVIGHTIDALGHPNAYNTRFITKENVTQRIDEMLNTDLIIVIPGRLGTLEELFVAWIRSIEGKATTILLVGDQFKKLIEFLVENMFIKLDNLKYINLIDSVEDIHFDNDGQVCLRKLRAFSEEGKIINLKNYVYKCKKEEKFA